MPGHRRTTAAIGPAILLAVVLALTGCATAKPHAASAPVLLADPSGAPLSLPTDVLAGNPDHSTTASAPHPVAVAPPAAAAPRKSTGSSKGTPAAPGAPSPSLGLSRGGEHDSAPNYLYNVSLANFPAGASVPVTCHGSADPNNSFTLYFTTNASGAASGQTDSKGNQCWSGTGQSHWVTSGAYRSNTVNW